MSSARREDHEREAREAILTRRLRFVKLAIAGVAAATATEACGSPCLRVAPPVDAGQDGGDAGPAPDGGTP
ncbi:MAG: hypothetical protein U0234_06425 [Sandaracinus sp.]